MYAVQAHYSDSEEQCYSHPQKQASNPSGLCFLFCHLYVFAANNRWRRHCVFWSMVRPSVRLLTPISHDTIALYLVEGIQRNLPQIFIM